MNIIRHIIHRPIAVTMIVIAVVALGGIALSRLPVSLLPDADIPRITVQISRPGASAKQIEQQLVKPLISRLSQLAGLKELEAVAETDAAAITLFFRYGSNIDLAFIEVNEKVDMTMGVLPKNTERPKIIKSSVTDIPAFFIDMTLKNGHDDMAHFIEMSDFASSVVRKRIEQLPQTAMVDMSGTVGRKILITPAYDIMRAIGLTTKDIEKALSDNDINVEALSVKDGQYRYNIHFDSQLLTANDIASIRINHNGRILTLSDFCQVEQRVGMRNGWVRHDGKNAVTMAVVKQAEARMSDLREGVDKTLADLRHKYPDIEFTTTRDQTELLTFSISNLESNLVMGVFLTCLVLFVFMHSWRPALLVAMTIPLSLTVTMLFFSLLGITLNVISLSGLILGVGMIVDNSIIVTDNIVQKWHRNMILEKATYTATAEVFTPMLSSVLTTCSVFVPLIFLSGLAGDLFYDQAMGISVSLLVSLAIAMLVVPVYFYSMYCRKKVPPSVDDKQMDILLNRWYERGLAFTLRKGRIVMCLFLFSIPGLAVTYILMDKQRMPEVEQTDVQVIVDWNEGITEEESDRRINELMMSVKGMAETTSSLSGTQQFILAHTPNTTAATSVGYLKSGNSATLGKACRKIRTVADSLYEGASVEFFPMENPFGLMVGSNEKTLEIRLQNGLGGRPSVAEAKAWTDSLRKRFPSVYFPSVNVNTNLMCKADLETMSLHGISYQTLLSRLRELTGDNKVMTINAGDLQIPVVVGDDRALKEVVTHASVTNSQGVEIPIGYLMKDSLVDDYKTLSTSADGGYYSLSVECGSSMAEQIMHYCDHLRRGSDRMVTYKGSYFSSRALVAELIVVLTVALALLFFIMAAQFESLVQPLIILSEIVLDCFVVLLVLWSMGMSLNLMSMIGIVVMSGIVINDSILKIDTINRFRKSGMTTLRAIVSAGRERLRPIVITTVTTMLAVVPFLSRGDMGSDLQYPISVTTIVGMSVGMLVSLFFVPLLYYVIYREKR